MTIYAAPSSTFSAVLAAMKFLCFLLFFQLEEHHSRRAIHEQSSPVEMESVWTTVEDAIGQNTIVTMEQTNIIVVSTSNSQIPLSVILLKLMCLKKFRMTLILF